MHKDIKLNIVLVNIILVQIFYDFAKKKKKTFNAK